MNNQIFLSRFTPSLMTPEVLERIFVQRGDLAQRLVEIVREGVLTPAKHHTLVLGPRGIGKTHLLSLVHHRIVAQEDLAGRMRVSWLREEEWGVATFLDLLHRILRTLVDTYDDPDLRAATEELFSLAPKVAERRAGDLLRSFLGGRTLVVLAENLDDMFDGLGTKGQQRLRAYLQEEESWTLVSTAQGLFSGVSLHQSPFYGFFEVHHLQELSVDDAATLIVNIAKLAGDDDLATFVQGPAGRARIRAVHHLAGGNHRVYVILSEFLTRESLDELVEPFMKMIDGLTPYYQSRMAQLSSQQRKIIDFLAETRGAVPVKQIASRCFMTSQTASGQLKDLREKGYVRSTPIGRDSYYELAEPLMRIALEVKKQREDPIRLFLDFLRYWYPRNELEDLLARVRPEAMFDQEYLKRAIEELSKPDGEEPHLTTEYKTRVAAGDWKNALLLAKRLVEARGNAEDWLHLGDCLLQLKEWSEACDAFGRSLAADSSLIVSWMGQSTALMALSRFDEALTTLSTASDLHPDDFALLALRVLVLKELGRLEEAITHLDKMIELAPNAVPLWRSRASLLMQSGRAAEAVDSVNHVLQSGEAQPMDWGVLGWALSALKRFEESAMAFRQHLDAEPESLDSLIGYGAVLFGLNRFAEAVSVFRRMTHYHPQDRGGWLMLGISAGRLEDHEAAVIAITTAVPYDQSGLASLFLAEELILAGRTDEASIAVADAERAGVDAGLVKLVRARELLVLGHIEEAVTSLDSAIGQVYAEDRLHKIGLGSPVTDLARTAPEDPSRLLRAKAILDVFRRHDLTGTLAAELLVAVNTAVRYSERTDAGLAWANLWKEAVGDDTDFSGPIEMLEAVARYYLTNDRRVILSLPSEKRSILDRLVERREMDLAQLRLYAEAQGVGQQHAEPRKSSRKGSTRKRSRTG